MKVVDIEKMFCVVLDHEEGEMPQSITIVRLFDEETSRTHYARWTGVNNVFDFLPNGPLYLADKFEEAVKIVNQQI